MAFGVPPILKYGSPRLQEKVLPDLLRGRKRICIAITEPEAGSDVAGIQTIADRTPSGDHFLVNGTKKWITNGIWSHYATMAVRTGGPGPNGLSLLLVPLLGHPGVNMRKIVTMGGRTGGTTFIELDDVRVPVENLIGEEGQGMRYIMTNFNHERLTISIGVTRQARVALAAAFQYVLQREAFGKTLIEQPVVRHRLAKAGALLESQSALVDSFVYQMTKLEKKEADTQLGGLTALAKAQAGIVFDECARCAVLLFGGNGLTTTGKGELAERKSLSLQYTVILKLFAKAYIAMFQWLAYRADQKMSCWIWPSGSLSRITNIRPRCSSVRGIHQNCDPVPP